jgi:ribonuclease D
MPRYALDTEFHRERTYFPKLALVQIATDERLALIDPLAVDVQRLADLLDSAAVGVFHACSQDLEVLLRSCGAVPRHLIDTQLVAGFVGHSTPSLATLSQAVLGLSVPKGDRLTDWLARPLTAEQQSYAASDVANLLTLWDRLAGDLTKRGRLDWAMAECELVRQRDWSATDPTSAWLKLKDHRGLRPKGRGVAREVAAWRERRAAQVDQPVRHVLSDLAIMSLAQKPPATLDQLRAVRGIDERFVRGALGAEVLDSIQRGAALPASATETEPADDLDRRLRPALTLVSAMASQLAHEADIDTPLLATRSDLVALLRGDADARLRHGWRADIVGDRIQGLLDGRLALAFEPSGSLVIEPRAAR